MNTAIVTTGPDAFWTRSYGAFRWHDLLKAKKAPWVLISLNNEFDQMRGCYSSAVPCVVDDFGDLVKVPQ